MTAITSSVRLYVDEPLRPGQPVPLSRDQAHYLGNVMRLSPGTVLTVFNGRDGAWAADVTVLSKRGGELAAIEQVSPQRDPPDLWLLFAPIKKARTDFIVEKATEMGAARILPVQTDFTNAERIRQDRLQAHAVEAAEQCGGTFVPQVEPLRSLKQALANWPEGRKLMFCDEARAGEHVGLPDRDGATSPWAILIGPEGGFSDAERARLAAMPQAHVVALGPRILRADTAAVAALTLWQSALGDWA